jgi:hypothetical protein
MAQRLEFPEPRPDRRLGAQVYLAAALSIVSVISLTAIAVWHLDSFDRGARLAAWSCCEPDR